MKGDKGEIKTRRKIGIILIYVQMIKKGYELYFRRVVLTPGFVNL